MFPLTVPVMLLRYLLRRDASDTGGDLSFRTRGAEVSRLEGFSDAVFGFAITLLVISSRAPDTSTELLALRHAVIPFVASFAVLFALWRAQFDFFRRYRLADCHTVHRAPRDNDWTAVYEMLLPVIIELSCVQLRASRRLTQARRALPGAGSGSEQSTELSVS